MSMSEKNTFLAQYGSEKHIDKLMENPTPSMTSALVQNHLLSTKHINSLIDNPNVNKDTKVAALKHHNADPETVIKGIHKLDNYNAGKLARESVALKPHHLKTLMHGDDKSIAEGAFNNKNANKRDGLNSPPCA